jgi:hypothetical protein
MGKETKLSYELCAQRMERWQALGRNYTAVQKKAVQQKGEPEQVVFYLLDLQTVI